MSEPAPAASADVVLRAESVRKAYRRVLAVDGASLSVARGSITALIGPNGAGKTTMFDVISGFLRPDDGDVLYEQRSIAGRSPEHIARRGVVRTFQLTRTFAAMSVLDNVLLSAPVQPGEQLLSLVFRRRAVARREREVVDQARELLARFDLGSKAGEFAGTLSGGQRKLLEMARAMMARPRVLLLDEPMAGVNPTLGRRIMEHVERARAEDGISILFVEHDLEVVMRHADRVVVMAMGAVIADAAPEAVRGDPRVLDAYLGTHSRRGDRVPRLFERAANG